MTRAHPGTVLVTGASGFVGRSLLPAFAARAPGARIVGADLHADGTGRDRVALDITDDAAVRRVVRDVRPEVCVHLAGVTHSVRAAQDEGMAWRANLFGALGLADTLREEAPDSTLIYVSTAEVYGPALSAGQPLTEEAPLAPANLYAVTKAAADLALGERAARGQHIVRFRAFNQTGPGQSPHLVVAYIAAQIASAEAGLAPPVIRLAAPEVARDFLDVADACDAYVLAALHSATAPPAAVYNIGSGVVRTIRSVAEDMAALSPLPFEVVATGPRRAVDRPWTCADASRARRELGWRPQRSWTSTLSSVLEDWRRRVAAGERLP